MTVRREKLGCIGRPGRLVVRRGAGPHSMFGVSLGNSRVGGWFALLDGLAAKGWRARVSSLVPPSPALAVLLILMEKGRLFCFVFETINRRIRRTRAERSKGLARSPSPARRLPFPRKKHSPLHSPRDRIENASH
jgi:hypothetical protein